MPTLSFLEQFTQTFVAEPFRQLARKTRWLRRQGKIDAFEFLTSLVFGQASASRPTLSSQSQSLAKPVSRQAIDQRYTAEAVDYIKASFTHVMTEVLDLSPTHPQAEQLRAHFKAVWLLDSTSFDCPDSLKELFPACGGDGSAANVKVLLRYEFINGRLEPLDVLPGRRSDQGQALQACERLQEDELQIEDKGFHDAKGWEAARQRGAYLLAPLPHSVTLWEPTADGSGEQLLDLAGALAATSENQLEWPTLYLGKKGVHRTGPVRLVAFRLSPESAARRRQGLRESMRKQGRTPSAQALELAGWLLLITNAPAEKLPSALMSYVYRVRWQIELIFRQMKSVLRLDKSESDNPFRLQCEIWARLICAVIFFLWYAQASAECAQRDRGEMSFEKLIRAMQHWGQTLARAFLEGASALLNVLRTLWKHLMTNGRKDRRKSRRTSRENLLLLLETQA